MLGVGRGHILLGGEGGGGWRLGHFGHDRGCRCREECDYRERRAIRDALRSDVRPGRPIYLLGGIRLFGITGLRTTGSYGCENVDAGAKRYRLRVRSYRVRVLDHTVMYTGASDAPLELCQRRTLVRLQGSADEAAWPVPGMGPRVDQKGGMRSITTGSVGNMIPLAPPALPGPSAGAGRTLRGKHLVYDHTASFTAASTSNPIDPTPVDRSVADEQIARVDRMIAMSHGVVRPRRPEAGVPVVLIFGFDHPLSFIPRRMTPRIRVHTNPTAPPPTHQQPSDHPSSTNAVGANPSPKKSH